MSHPVAFEFDTPVHAEMFRADVLEWLGELIVLRTHGRDEEVTAVVRGPRSWRYNLYLELPAGGE